MTFEKKYVGGVDKTSSAYRRRAMVEITDDIDDLLTEFRQATRLNEATSIRLATLAGLRFYKHLMGFEQLRYLADKNRVRK